MSIGVRAGVVPGVRCGVAVGVLSDAIVPPSSGTVIPGVTRDSASGKYFPATAAEWTLLMAAAGLATGNPTVAWTLQDASGNPTDFMGGSVVLGVNAAPTYQSPVPGYSRFGIRFVDGTASQRMFNNSAAPNPALTSTLVFAVVQFPSSAPAAARGIITKTATTPRVALNTTGKLQLVDGGTSDLVNSILGATRPIMFLTQLTALASKVFTDQEKFSGTFGVPAAGAFIGFAGTAPAVAADTAFLYAAEFSGTAAELSDAQVKTLLQTLGWTIGWT